MQSLSHRKRIANPLRSLAALALLAFAFSSCGTYHTVTDLVTSHVPERYTGRASIVVDLGEQQAYLYRGKHRTAASRISSGREGHRTPIGRFSVIRKDIDHRSSLYGNYVENSGRVVKANVDSRKRTAGSWKPAASGYLDQRRQHLRRRLLAG